MGMSGAAVFVRNEKRQTRSALLAQLTAYMESQGYPIAEAGENAFPLMLHFPEGRGWFA